MSLLRYRKQDIAAVLDKTASAGTAGELLQHGGAIPVVGTLAEIEQTDALYLGIAPPGGRLPVEWKSIMLEALDRKMDVVSGFHDFLNDDDELVAAAATSNAKLIDIRNTSHETTAKGVAKESAGIRIHTVGHDCSVGKMVASIEIQLGLLAYGRKSSFVATGQTGIMISGQGIPIDRTIVDFTNGAAESLIANNEGKDFLLIEGQGSISHPAFSAVTLGLLHGCAPHGLVFCYEAGRQKVKGLPEIDLPDMSEQINAYLTAARLRHPCDFIGVAVNTRNLDEMAAKKEVDRIEKKLDLPACDVYRDGPRKLVDACLELERKLGVS